jgi:putative BNR repeat neuraminidase
MAIDDGGYIWIFSNSHGTSRPSYIWRSAKPYDIARFDLIKTTNFSYGNVHYVPGKGFLFLHTLYRNKGRSLFWSTSRDGVEWGNPSLLSRIDLGHYEITAQRGDRVVSVFNYHPSPLGLNARTNIYFLQTSDMGKTWTNIENRPVTPPLTTVQNPALVRDFRKEGLLVYLKNVEFDAKGNPVILFLTSKGFEPGPVGGPRQWQTARWTGKQWDSGRSQPPTTTTITAFFPLNRTAVGASLRLPLPARNLTLREVTLFSGQVKTRAARGNW